MLTLKHITKDYYVAGEAVHALKDVSLSFRKNEFVSILGQSGCGKTTLLNIIGGLDRYTSGDLIIAGVSTKKYRDGDWDTYRNHSIGFVFQSYNLIPHQTVLENVELALTLSGVSRSERKKRARAVLDMVGLSEHALKKPNQLSGGQMQRVAIARALINDPEILLADEPTGALDSETSIQVMDILKKVADDRLVIMVTHNAELAEQYSTRIVRLSDGLIVGDTNPFAPSEEKKTEGRSVGKKKAAMSFGTALSLSLKNLMTKKTRTLLTSFAGSIGIIGIALILAMSNGIQTFINRVQTDTLSSYPLTINSSTFDLSSLIASADRDGGSDIEDRDENKIYTSSALTNMVNAMNSGVTENDLKALKAFIESDECVYVDDRGNKHNIKEYVSDISYEYNVPLLIYASDTKDGAQRLDPTDVFRKIYGDLYDTMIGSSFGSLAPMSGMANIWDELIDNEELLKSQYQCLAGEWPTEKNEIMLFVNSEKELSDLVQYALGLRDINEVDELVDKVFAGEKVEIEQLSFTYDDLLSMEFKLLLPTDYYSFDEKEGIWKDITEDGEALKEKVDGALTLKISGIAMPDPDATATSTSAYVGYTKELTKYIVEGIAASDVVKYQQEHPDTDIFTGIEFSEGEITAEDVRKAITEMSNEELAVFMTAIPSGGEEIQPEVLRGMLLGMEDENLMAMYEMYFRTEATYDGNIKKLGVCDYDDPAAINIFPLSFDDKDIICGIIDSYNERMEQSGEEEKVISYTDSVGILMSSITTIIDAISIVLIAFVSVSLVVSSIMIGVITYISVLERTKEIGILRACGASKKDISRVFNAETLIVGFAAGAIGIGLTLLLTIPINAIIYHFAQINVSAILPVAGGIILVVISMLLTFVAGLIPASVAAKRDPVVALRSE